MLTELTSVRLMLSSCHEKCKYVHINKYQNNLKILIILLSTINLFMSEEDKAK